ncbi:MAG: hypothetical protein KC503_37405 [Myxococcales bacterium]|nr:hypothetical protein [Myxococcales bacterium]
MAASLVGAACSSESPSAQDVLGDTVAADVAGDAAHGDLAAPDGGPARDGAPVNDAAAASDATVASDATGEATSEGGTDAFSWQCGPARGLAAPLPACTASAPCTRPGKELGVTRIDGQGAAPLCKTSAAGRGVFDDSPPRTRVDSRGITRHVCLFEPPGASAAAPRALVIFLHGGNGSADNAYDNTSLRAKAASFDLSGTGQRPGFFLLSIHGRNVHYPTHNPRDGRHHDFYYRDLASPSSNPDVENVDAWIDQLVASGKVDRKRIYLTGWSNGGFFSQMYAIARHNTATPGGSRVAAAVPFTAADPFNNTSPTQTPSCKLAPYPQSTVPLLVVSRSCDIVACDAQQAAALTKQGAVLEPGHVVGPWIADLASQVKNPNVERLIVSGKGAAVQSCDHLFCIEALALLNHVRWPDGVADKSGTDHEPRMLGFMRDHPLP